MAISYRELYRRGESPMPNSDDKDKEWALGVCRHVFGRYEDSDFLIAPNGYVRGVRTIWECRAYARGTQDPKKYEDIVLFKDKDHNVSKSISMDTYKILTKFMSIAKEKVLSNELEPRITINDIAGINHKSALINKYKMFSNPQVKQLADQIGFDYGHHIPILKTPQDVEIFDKLGGIQLDIEIELVDAIQSVTKDGNFDFIESSAVSDLLEIGMCAAYIHTYPDMSMEVRPIDISKSILPYTTRQDGVDAPYSGFIEELTTHQIAEMFDVDKDTVRKIPIGSKSYMHALQEKSQHIKGNSVLNKQTADVLRLFIVAEDTEYYVDGKHHKYGNAVFDPIGSRSKVRDDKKEKKSYKIHNVYEIAWVIGTDIILRVEKTQCVARDGKKGYKKAMLPIVKYQMDVPSLVERAIPIIDDMQIAIYKMRQMLSKIPPGPRMVIMKNVLRPSVKLGNHSYSILDMLELFQSEGVFVLDLEDDFDTEKYNNMGKPIDFIQTGVAEDLTILRGEIASKMEELRQVTGINEVADGTTSNKDMLRSVMKGLDEASNSSLAEFYRARKSFVKNLYKYIGRKSQEIAFMYGDRELVYFKSGKYSKRKVTEEIGYHEFDINISVIPGKQETEMLMQILAQDKQQRVIDDADFFVIMRMLMEGDTRKAQLYYSVAVGKAKEERQMQQMQQQQMQMQNNQMAAQAAQQRDQSRSQTELGKIQAKGQVDAQLNEQKAMLKIKRDGIKNP